MGGSKSVGNMIPSAKASSNCFMASKKLSLASFLARISVKSINSPKLQSSGSWTSMISERDRFSLDGPKHRIDTTFCGIGAPGCGLIVGDFLLCAISKVSWLDCTSVQKKDSLRA